MKETPDQLNPNAIVDWFAKMELSSPFKQSDPDEAAKLASSGNSRDLSIPFFLHCGICECEYKICNLGAFEKHQINCEGTANPSYDFFHPVNGRPKLLSTAGSLKSHEISQHEFEPRAYARCLNKKDVIYHTCKEWSRHQRAEHADRSIICVYFHIRGVAA